MRKITYAELEELLEYTAQSFEIETEISKDPDVKKYLKAFPIGVNPETIYLLIEYMHERDEILQLPENYKDRITTCTSTELANKVQQYLKEQMTKSIVRVLDMEDPPLEILQIEESIEEKHPDLKKFLKYFKENEKGIKEFSIISSKQILCDIKSYFQTFYRLDSNEEKYISTNYTEEDSCTAKYDGYVKGSFRFYSGIENLINYIKDYIRDAVQEYNVMKIEIRCGEGLFNIYNIKM